MPTKPVISTRLRPAVAKLIKANAESREMTVADWYKHAILEELKKQGLTGHKEDSDGEDS